MDITANFLETNIEAPIDREASPAENRDSHTLDTPLQRLAHNVMSVDSYFLQRKSQLDRVTYSILQVNNFHLAQELFFRIQDGEATFAELASQYSGGQETKTGGLIGSQELSVPHPILAQRLRSLRSGQLAAPIQITDCFVVIRLEQYLPAQLDSAMRKRLANELYEQWLQAQLMQLIVA